MEVGRGIGDSKLLSDKGSMLACQIPPTVFSTSKAKDFVSLFPIPVSEGRFDFPAANT